MTQATIGAGAPYRRAETGSGSGRELQEGNAAYTRTRGHKHAYTRGAAQDVPNTRTHVHARRFEGGSITISTLSLCRMWGALIDGCIRLLDARTWLACYEVKERRKFSGRGREAVYEPREVASLLGGSELQARASIRRLQRAGVLTWTASGPQFEDSLDSLADERSPSVLRMVELMPARRRSFPMPRRIVRLLAGGVKRSVMATVFGHLLRCPHYTRAEGWDPVGACKSSWVGEVFGISQRSAKRARAHLVDGLGWLIPEDAEQWFMNRHGGCFGVNLSWNAQTPATVGEGQGATFSTGQMSPRKAALGTRLSPPESKHALPSGLQESTPGGELPGPEADSSKKSGEGTKAELPAPKLTKLIREDLPSVPRVMELFDQALESPAWRRRGWTPNDSHLERLNWAAAARRAHVRGSTNPCGVFVHLVSHRKWDHISNDDEDAVRRDLARWMNPEPEAPSGRGEGARRPAPKLSSDAKVLRVVEATLRRHGVDASVQRVNRELAQRGGWSATRIADARTVFEAWKGQGSKQLQEAWNA